MKVIADTNSLLLYFRLSLIKGNSLGPSHSAVRVTDPISAPAPLRKESVNTARLYVLFSVTGLLARDGSMFLQAVPHPKLDAL